MRPIMRGFVDGGYNNGNTRTANRLKRNYAGFMNDLDLFTEEELAVEPMYVRHFRPLGLGWSASTAIRTPANDVIVFDLEQRYEKGPVRREVLQKLDEYRPHIARAALASSRLGLEQARNATATFEMIGLPAAVLTRSRQIIAVNAMMEEMRPQLRFLSHDRLCFVDSHAQVLLEQGLEQCAGKRDAAQSIALPAIGEAPPAIAHILPIRGSGRDIFARGDVVLLITAVGHRSVPTVDILAGMFDLTPAEARIARAIGKGLTAQAAAASSQVSTETVRTQVKSVLAKTGVRRQVELSALLASLSSQMRI
jgi:DNA-binding CsgD family transcriptional regulator